MLTFARSSPTPQKVLHVRALPPGVSSDEVVSYMGQFGTVAYVVMLPKRGQALVEMESLDSSIAVMSYAESSPVGARVAAAARGVARVTYLGLRTGTGNDRWQAVLRKLLTQ